jgi:phosphopantetheine--protein transferase-like protein
MIELQTAPTFNGRIFERLESVKDVAEKAQRSPEFLDDILSPEERREYESKVAPKRAAEWLSGRAALKSGILRMAKLGGNSVPALNSVRIMNDELGRPYIAPGSENLGIEHVSISHANGLAAGACAKGCRFRGFGIDIQQVESRSEAWAGDYFTAQELGGLNPADDRHKALTAMWCLKEATVKALGAGLRFDLKEIEVSRMSPAGSAAIALRGESAQAMAKLGASEIDASIEEREGIVTAYVALR